jgi:hypothetical protein
VSERLERAREQGVTLAAAAAEDVVCALDAAVPDQLLAVLGPTGSVHRELVCTLADRAVEALDDDDLRAVIAESAWMLGVKAQPAGFWRDRRDSESPVTVADVVRATLAGALASRLWQRLEERSEQFRTLGEAA